MFFKDFLNHINLLLLPDSACQKHKTLKEKKKGTVKCQYQGTLILWSISCWEEETWRTTLENQENLLQLAICLHSALATRLLGNPTQMNSRAPNDTQECSEQLFFLIAKKQKWPKCPSTREQTNISRYLPYNGLQHSNNLKGMNSWCTKQHGWISH